MLRALGRASCSPASSATTPTACASAGSLLDLGIDDEAVLIDPDRPSTVKERYIGRAQHRHPQQMIRVDYEVRNATLDGTEAAS